MEEVIKFAKELIKLRGNSLIAQGNQIEQILEQLSQFTNKHLTAEESKAHKEPAQSTASSISQLAVCKQEAADESLSLAVQVHVDPTSETPVEEVKKVGNYRNYVGELMEFCVSKNYPAPSFQLYEQLGPPHNRVFGIECSFLGFTTRGNGTSKKIAKQNAAKKLLQILYDYQAPEKQTMLENALKKDKMKKFAQVDIMTTISPLLNQTKLELARRESMSQGLNGLQCLKYKSITLLNIMKEYIKITRENSFDLLKQIISELRCSVTIEGICGVGDMNSDNNMIKISENESIQTLSLEDENLKKSEIVVITCILDVDLVAFGSNVHDSALNMLCYIQVLGT